MPGRARATLAGMTLHPCLLPALGRPLPSLRVALALVAATALPAMLWPGAAWAAPGSEPGGIDIRLRTEAEPSDFALPPFPGAQRRRDAGEDGSGVSLALLLGGKGLKLAVQQYRSERPVDEVAAFYQRELARLGPVLDCSAGSAAARAPRSQTELDCGDDRPEAGARVYKAGTRQRFHLVAIRPLGGGARFDLVRIDVGR